MSRLFESRSVRKRYLALVQGVPSASEWTCRLKIGPEPGDPRRMRIEKRTGVEAETLFRVLKRGKERALIEAMPVTGRTHQIRLHLAAGGNPVIGDELYGSGGGALGLRAVEIAYVDPFQRRDVRVIAPEEGFLRRADVILEGVG
jgi:23S rRNA pseudouridine1911/1915/1917 synthase